MKPLIAAVLATLLGAAMLALGIAGVAGAFDDGSSSGDSAEDVADFESCPTTDDRFTEFGAIELTGSAGSAHVTVSCESGEIELSMISGSLIAEEPRAVALWLYNSRKSAEFVASAGQTAGDAVVVISGTLPSDSADYKKLVVTEESNAYAEPEAPTKVILQGRP